MYATKSIKKAGVLSLVALLACAAPLSVTVAGGNGSGNEPPGRSGGTSEPNTVCKYIPWICVISDSGGNGSGNEPD